MTDKEALQRVLDAAVEHWSNDTRDRELKVALQRVENMALMFPYPTLEQLAHYSYTARRWAA